MPGPSIHRALLAVPILLAAPACVHKPRPPMAHPHLARARLVVQPEFRVAAFDFGVSDVLEEAETETMRVREAVPAMLLTALRDAGRFAVHDGGNIRGPKAALDETSAHRYVDAYLSGTLTALGSEGRACFDVRLANAWTHEVMYAEDICLQTGGRGTAAASSRAALKRLAEDLSRSMERVREAEVVSVDGKLVVVDKGTSSGLQRGRVGYVVATGEVIHDASLHRQVESYTGVVPPRAGLGRIPSIVGELYLVSVEDAYSVGLLVRGDYVLPKDTVVFK